MATRSKASRLWIIGTPLAESEAVHPHAVQALNSADLIVGESRKQTDTYLRKAGLSDEKRREIIVLDPLPPAQARFLKDQLTELSRTGGTVALLSDHGMPLLFDPGTEWVKLARDLGFSLRTSPGPTSWGTACVTSLLAPPFWIEGFLPRDAEARKKAWNHLKTVRAHRVLLETPYRFGKLLDEVCEHLGEKHPLYLAWQLGQEDEAHLWLSAGEMRRQAEKENRTKGEFILILERT